MAIFSNLDLYMLCTVKQRLYGAVLNAWFGRGRWTRLLLPLTFIFNGLVRSRKDRLLAKDRWEPPVPIIIVGNITVGGTGKTPVVASFVKGLQDRGYHPGIISRGFGGSEGKGSQQVTAQSIPEDVGDEPLMLFRQLDVPVVVNPDRVSAARMLYEQFACDLIIADDGLQHYNLKRHVEVLVIDGKRMFGNGLCLPAGPLREPIERLQTVDFVLTNGEPLKPLTVSYTTFTLLPEDVMPLSTLFQEQGDPPREGSTVHGVAGIGDPDRFFNTLSSLGFNVIAHHFPDHYPFKAEDICFNDEHPVIMTAKDAVKCVGFATKKHWYLPVKTNIPATVFDEITSLVTHTNAR